MAVTMVGGNSFAMIHSLFDPVHSMASQIASEFTEATYSLYIFVAHIRRTGAVRHYDFD